ncbi:acyltransferase, partial [Pseudomonas aeruginosa]
PWSLLYYPLFVVLLLAFCVLFQERGVVPVRKWLVRRLRPAPALAKVPRPA